MLGSHIADVPRTYISSPSTICDVRGTNLSVVFYAGLLAHEDLPREFPTSIWYGLAGMSSLVPLNVGDLHWCCAL
jgi:hypothetical protein